MAEPERADEEVAREPGEAKPEETSKPKHNKIIRRIGLGLAGLLALTGITFFPKIMNVFSPKPKNPVYQYAVGIGMPKEMAEILSKKINPRLEPNDRTFIDIISAYPEAKQKACINSDILDNRHISKAELKATRKATLEGIANPSEIYAVLANGDSAGQGDLERYSQENVEYSLGNLLAFYELFKDNGVDDENINLLVYNPTNASLTDNATHKFFKNGGKFLTIKDGKIVPSDVPSNELLPLKETNIVVDDISTKENFEKYIRGLKSDANDTLFIVYSDAAFITSRKPHESEQKKYWQFSDNFLTYDTFGGSLQDIKYGKTVVIANTPENRDFLENLDKGGPGYAYSKDRKPFVREILAIESPNSYGFYKETWMSDLASRFRGNPNMTMKDVLDIGKGTGEEKDISYDAYYYNKEGYKRPLQECAWFYQPLITKE
ncbi:MAG: hypothetical protein PHH00_01650 [Candidatus Nanoarchaeia archaeon]|nr:hypothetical protein [Candidatus Nanoarchaeia archaeon]